MQCKPILFNTEMVRAILEGRKTVTRRLIKLPTGTTGFPVGRVSDKDNPFGFQYPGGIKRPQYMPGDILYVRETWTELFYVDPAGYTHFDESMFYYAADGDPQIVLVDGDGFELDDQRIKWKPSIHMPKKAARLFLKVTDVRAERLHDMSVEDIRKEGIRLTTREEECHCAWATEDCQQQPCANRDAYLPAMYVSKFAALWDSTIKDDRYLEDSYSKNPWVWVIEFERCEKPKEVEGKHAV